MDDNTLLLNFLMGNHDNRILANAIDTINSFLEDENCDLWLYDEENNVIKPKGKLNYVLMSTYKNYKD